MFAEQNEKLLADLEAKGMVVSKPNLDPFRDATKAVYAEWSDVFGKDLVDRVLKAATK